MDPYLDDVATNFYRELLEQGVCTYYGAGVFELPCGCSVWCENIWPNNTATYINAPIAELQREAENGNNSQEQNIWVPAIVGPGCGFSVGSLYGTMVLFPYETIRIDFTIDGAIWITDNQAGLSASVNADGNTYALRHPLGWVNVHDKRIEFIGYKDNRNHKLAKMFPNGIRFTCKKNALTVMIDDAGTRTTRAKHFRRKLDEPKTVFYTGSQYGEELVPTCLSILDRETHNAYTDYEQWIINNIKIVKRELGTLKIFMRNRSYQFTVRENGFIKLDTPLFYCCASNGREPHLYIKQREGSLYFNKKKFSAKYRAYVAGFDQDDKFRLF